MLEKLAEHQNDQLLAVTKRDVLFGPSLQGPLQTRRRTASEREGKSSCLAARSLVPPVQTAKTHLKTFPSLPVHSFGSASFAAFPALAVMYGYHVRNGTHLSG